MSKYSEKQKMKAGRAEALVVPKEATVEVYVADMNGPRVEVSAAVESTFMAAVASLEKAKSWRRTATGSEGCEANTVCMQLTAVRNKIDSICARVARLVV